MASARVSDSSRARVLHAGFPPGYGPKRTTTLVQPMPELAGALDDLHALLASVHPRP